MRKVQKNRVSEEDEYRLHPEKYLDLPVQYYPPKNTGHSLEVLFAGKTTIHGMKKLKQNIPKVPLSVVKKGSELLDVFDTIITNNNDLGFVKGQVIEALKGMVLVPEEKHKELETLAVKGILYNSLIKDFHKEQSEHRLLNEKFQRIKTLIDNFPESAFIDLESAISYDNSLREWIDELRKAIE
jgi:hypothetical protein